MKTLSAIAMGSAVVMGAIAQQAVPPPVTSAPPPITPNVAPARAQPGVATGASGRSAIPGTVSGLGGLSNGSATFTPFPVVVPPNTYPIYPEVLDPLDVVEVFQILDSLPEPAANVGTARGRPGGGLGVTITGGSASPPPVATPPPPVQVPVVTNVPAVTNLPAVTNATTVTNAAPAPPANPPYR